MQDMRNHAIREELTQILGLMKDSNTYYDSIFYEDLTNTDKFSETDKKLIKMLYLKSIKPKMNKEEVLNTLMKYSLSDDARE